MADSIIVFDGVCVLCSRWVGFVLRRDRAGRFKFAAMQTPTGRELLTKHGIDADDPLTFLVIEDGNRYRLFGQRPACLVPTTEVADRFLH